MNISYNTTAEPEWLQNVTSTLEEHNPNDDPVSFIMWCLACAAVWLICCSKNRRRIPPRELWRGEQIRENAQRLWAEQAERQQRKEIPFVERQAQIQQNMRSQCVQGLDQEGNWILGSVNLASAGASSSPQNEDDDQACMICLDPFQVGDVVSWSRYSETCCHVFHKECIHPWFQEKRQEECPTCRSKLMIRPPLSWAPTSPTTTSETDDELYDEENPPPPTSEPPVTPKQLEGDREEEDSPFVIMHGLISRVTNAASRQCCTVNGSAYTRIETKGSCESQNSQLAAPFPLRRVVTHGHGSSSPPNPMLSSPVDFRRVKSLEHGFALRRSPLSSEAEEGEESDELYVLNVPYYSSTELAIINGNSNQLVDDDDEDELDSYGLSVPPPMRPRSIDLNEDSLPPAMSPPMTPLRAKAPSTQAATPPTASTYNSSANTTPTTLTTISPPCNLRQHSSKTTTGEESHTAEEEDLPWMVPASSL